MKPRFCQSSVLTYAIALGCALVAFSIRWVAAPVLDDHAPLLLFLLAAMAAAWVGGLGPGIAAAVLGELLGDFFFMEPAYTLGPRDRVEWAYLLAFLAEAGVAIAIVETLRSTRALAGNAIPRTGSSSGMDTAIQKPAEEALVNKVDELRAAQETLSKRNEELASIRQALEDRVHDRTAELEAANRELEAFSYSVSHDLRAPLRSISGFSKAVLEEYQHKLDDRGVTYLQYAYDASQRMNRLIEDLITLSRYTRCDLRLSPVDLSAIVKLIFEDLRLSEPQRQVQVEIAPGLRTVGDEGLLRIALDNLLRNAWKFTGKQPFPKIEFGAIKKNGVSLYFVRDNGAGFDMQRAERLFGVFQRLHSVEEFPGTGIGLATVKRIFHRHGGDIWAEARQNEGATFYFTLPDPPAKCGTSTSHSPSPIAEPNPAPNRGNLTRTVSA